MFSRGVDADVIVVADEANDFGTYIAFRTYEPRLVVGTQGLTAATWHPAQDAYGSAQLQSRFLRSASRTMRPVDYQAWVAARMIGEATTRTKARIRRRLPNSCARPISALPPSRACR